VRPLSIQKHQRPGSGAGAGEGQAFFAVHLEGVIRCLLVKGKFPMRGAKRLQEIGDSVGIISVGPPMGPFCLDDSAGMRVNHKKLFETIYFYQKVSAGINPYLYDYN
jgi:hypothetical protein